MIWAGRWECCVITFLLEAVVAIPAGGGCRHSCWRRLLPFLPEAVVAIPAQGGCRHPCWRRLLPSLLEAVVAIPAGGGCCHSCWRRWFSTFTRMGCFASVALVSFSELLNLIIRYCEYVSPWVFSLQWSYSACKGTDHIETCFVLCEEEVVF